MQGTRVAFLFAFIVLSISSFSQQKWPNTLLWKISGNGLKKPSYLYGTMHLQDKRLFQFTDSVYQALENVEGFALEIDFNELVDSMLSREFKKAEEDLLDKMRLRLKDQATDDDMDSIVKALKVDPESISNKDLKKIRDYRMNRLVQRGEMQTIVDGYLYGLALRMGKWLGGIEDVTDQLDLKDELGADLRPDEVFLPEKILRGQLEDLVKIYLNKDLQKIDEYTRARYSSEQRQVIQVQRNYKMAARMDSLSMRRTMFFAVGAAHLPGEEGVITLLRQKGFTVTPIFSSQSVKPEVYAAKLSAQPWHKIEETAFDLEMPGPAKDFDLFGDAMKMKVFFDLPTMTFYMAGNGVNGKKDLDLDTLFADMVSRMGSLEEKVKSKKISIGKLAGREGRFNTEQGAVKIRLYHQYPNVYFLVAFSSREANLDSRDVSRFYNSFVAKEIPVNNNSWSRFTIPGKGFSIEIPGKPKPNKAVDQQAEGTEWKFSTYDYTDHLNGIYYLVQVRDLTSGYYLEGDTSYYAGYLNDIRSRFDTIYNNRHFHFEGWPAFELKADLKNSGFRILNIQKANRIYSFIVGGATPVDYTASERFFKSLLLEEYTEQPWKVFSGTGFQTRAPASFKPDEDMEPGENEIHEEHYTSYDELTTISYEVFKSVVSPYYWVKDDSTFFADQIKQYRNYNDSIVEKKFVTVGKLKAMDYTLKKDDNISLRKVRVFVNRDTVYTLISFMPQQFRENENVAAFFKDIRLAREVNPVIYTNKAKQLFTALRSKDTAVFNQAFSALDQVSFTKAELPLLHEALMQDYLESDSYSTAYDKISNELKLINDKTTLDFISKNYGSLKGEKEAVKLNMLEILVNHQSKESYALFSKLVKKDPPKSGNANNLYSSLQDSLPLTATLYPGILEQLDSEIFSDLIVNLSKLMVDSNYLSLADFAPYKNALYQKTEEKIKKHQEDSESYYWWYNSWISMLGKLNDLESNQLLRKLTSLDDFDIKYQAVMALINNEMPVDHETIDTLAASLSFRKYFYTELEKIDRLLLFPSKYATRLKIAESEIYNIGSDDVDVSSVEFLSEKEVLFMGAQRKFLLFRVGYENEEGEMDYYLGLTGPYEKDEIIADTRASGIYWENSFKPSLLEQQLRDLLRSMEEYLEEGEDD